MAIKTEHICTIINSLSRQPGWGRPKCQVRVQSQVCTQSQACKPRGSAAVDKPGSLRGWPARGSRQPAPAPRALADPAPWLGTRREILNFLVLTLKMFTKVIKSKIVINYLLKIIKIHYMLFNIFVNEKQLYFPHWNTGRRRVTLFYISANLFNICLFKTGGYPVCFSIWSAEIHKPSLTQVHSLKEVF